LERAAKSERPKSGKCDPMTGLTGVSLRKSGVLRRFKEEPQPEGYFAGCMSNQDGKFVPKGQSLAGDALDGRQSLSSKTAYGADIKYRETVVLVRKAHGERRSVSLLEATYSH